MKKNYRYLLNAILIAMVIAGLLQYFQSPPQAAPSPLRDTAVDAFRSLIIPLKTEDLSAKLQKSGQPKLLFIYASWCPYCKRQMPIVEEIVKSGKYPTLELISVSIDQDKTALAEYLSQLEPVKGFVPYHSQSPRDIVKLLKPMGGHFQGSIPYLAVFDGQGKMTKEFLGLSTKEMLEAALPTP